MPTDGKTSEGKPAPLVSVIIPVYNDADRLTKCLEALSRQTYPEDSLEIVVVDNGSDDKPDRALARFPKAHLLHEPRPGSYKARNMGIETARGDVFAFTDADCVPSPTWIEEGVHAMARTDDSTIIAGEVKLCAKNPEKPTAVELFDMFTSLNQQRCVETHQFGVTANLFVHRKVMGDVGPFREDLKSGGDYEWGRRAASHGYRVLYVGAALVEHPTRYALSEVIAKERRVRGGKHQLRADGSTRGVRIRQLFSDFMPPITRSRMILTDKALPSFRSRIKVVGVIWTVKYVSALEGLRLIFGGASKR